MSGKECRSFVENAYSNNKDDSSLCRSELSVTSLLAADLVLKETEIDSEIWTII